MIESGLKSEFALRTSTLSKKFVTDNGGEIQVLKELDLTVANDELLVILGSSGSGKTTLLNLIAGLLCADSGKIEYGDGLVPEKNIPCVFQHYTLFPWHSVLKNVAFGLDLQGVDKKHRYEIASELINQVGLQGFEKSFPHELSGGMRQRAALAQALAISPKMLLLDEPFGALDDSIRRDLQKKVVKLQGEKKIPMIFVTHNIDEALMLADRILIMGKNSSGFIAEKTIDTPRPRDPSSKDFNSVFIELRLILEKQL